MGNKEEIEFCEKRIQEQLDYIDKINASNIIPEQRKIEIVDSATSQLNYFRSKLKAEEGNKETFNLFCKKINGK